MKILQVIGYKNSGKTTLIEKLIKYLSEKRIRIATIKHHGHGTALAPLSKDSTDGYVSDSERFLIAGAIFSVVLSPIENRLDFSSDTVHQRIMDSHFKVDLATIDRWTIDDFLNFFMANDIDLVIVEGYKDLPYPKIIVSSDGQDIPKVLHAIDTLIGSARTVKNVMPHIDDLPSY